MAEGTTRPGRARPPRRGRRPGQPVGRDLILAAANVEFGEHGYQGATVRSIASLAGVDTKLVHYYFGTKAELFTAAIAATFRARGFPDMLAPVPGGGNDGSPGTEYVAAILTALEESEIGPAFIGLVRNLGTREESRQIFLRFVTRELIDTVAPRLEGARAESRVSLAGSHLLGVVLARYVLKIPPLAVLSRSEVAQAIGTSIDRYIFEDLGWDQA